ncbi:MULTISPECIES: methyl-accepting chemotaxis protein [Cellvibrio]|jgi:methyl-accepting chemotaxis protein|uniref:Methyl-accepting chemotaxis protein n=1 Tax=Cellvibrio fibrivorans TaxID=126350 RepID=A0ABU1V1S7_9GAMM|nr:methyl-accepting chemotaxis protein [Cellvibrio fibrivorans]MDR7091360.1 methyl-accepting chemotaxis protein [Cellvibrio fibrivorans]
MSLRVKIWIVSAQILIGLLGIMLIGLYTVRYTSNQDNAARVEQLLNSTYATVIQMEQMAARGELDDETAKKIATTLLRNNIYHKSEYVYVADEKLNFVAAPLDPQIHGTSFHEFKDGKGNSVGEILQKAVDKANGQLARYKWTKKLDDGTIEDKLSIAKLSPRWNWVVGTGIGFNEVNARFWETAKWQLTVCLLVMLFIVVPVVLFARKLDRGLGAELKEVLTLVRAVAGGDLTERDVRQAPEDSIYGSVVRMRHALREVIGGISQMVARLHSISDDIVHKAETSTAMAEDQSINTIKIASSAEEFNMQTKDAMQQAKVATNQTDHASKTATQGQKLISSAVKSFVEIDNSVIQTQGSIDDLANRINSISAVISVISEVANQTNLLALNAAIEAARAGEQGRGFAVVADEVRQLAQRTTQATSEISETITAVQNSSRVAKQNMDDMVVQLKEGIGQTRQGGEIVESVRHETDEVAKMVAHIGSSLIEHVQASSLILEYVSQVEQSSLGTKDAARGTLMASQQIRDASDELSRQLEGFRL